jgi:hypothetical protein
MATRDSQAESKRQSCSRFSTNRSWIQPSHVNKLDEDDRTIRAIVACAQDANLKLIEKMKRGNDGLRKVANASLEQLEQVFRLPPHGDLYNMSSVDYMWYQERIAKAIKQYRAHTERDLDDLQMLREQTALQASLIWEQQMQICKMNEAYLQLSDEKNRIVQADNQLVHKGMEHITTMMARSGPLRTNRSSSSSWSPSSTFSLSFAPPRPLPT